MKASGMTPDQIRVRCAEIEGWIKVKKWPHPKSSFFYRSPDGLRFEVDIPDYTNSIDAINAAVLRLPDRMKLEWIEKLSERICATLYLATASALDRAKAFVEIHENPSTSFQVK